MFLLVLGVAAIGVLAGLGWKYLQGTAFPPEYLDSLAPLWARARAAQHPERPSRGGPFVVLTEATTQLYSQSMGNSLAFYPCSLPGLEATRPDAVKTVIFVETTEYPNHYKVLNLLLIDVDGRARGHIKDLPLNQLLETLQTLPLEP